MIGLLVLLALSLAVSSDPRVEEKRARRDAPHVEFEKGKTLQTKENITV